jgi:hypothetical protein
MSPSLRWQPWQWSLRPRLAWALLFFRGDAEELSKATDHILQSYQVQTSDLAGAKIGRDRFHVLSMAARQVQEVPGLAMEFGVFKGVTLRHIARKIGARRQVTGFDTFEGLPEDWGKLLPKGTFATKVPSFKEYPNVSIEAGRIEETLPAFLKRGQQAVALVHIDCPYYEINVFILDRLLPFMPNRSVVVFDEYYGYPAYEDHEFRAWAEIRERAKLVTTPLAYSSRSAAFEIRHNPRYSL